jgi:hypothetical protein
MEARFIQVFGHSDSISGLRSSASFIRIRGLDGNV